MNYQDRQARLDAERHLLRAAMARLRDGEPQRSSGKLTAAALAVEAGIARQRLYEQHGELLTQFKITAGGGPTSPSVQALRQQLADAHDRIRNLEADNILLTQRITTLCAVITELTHEAQADNVVTLRQARQH